MDSSSLVPGNNVSKSEPPVMDSKLPGKAEDGDQKKASSLPAPPKPLEKAVAAAATAASATATAASATTTERSALGGAYPNPSNFAERLMHVLDNEIAKESLWWLGNGEAIAVHPEKIKESPVLASHFQGNRYTSFIRNLNRWCVRYVCWRYLLYWRGLVDSILHYLIQCKSCHYLSIHFNLLSQRPSCFLRLQTH